jgi:hypothetical protein
MLSIRRSTYPGFSNGGGATMISFYTHSRDLNTRLYIPLANSIIRLFHQHFKLLNYSKTIQNGVHVQRETCITSIIK